MMWYWGGGVHWWGWLLGTVGMIAFWVLVIWAVWFVATSVMGGRPGPDRGPGPRQGPREILDERLARGEIDAEQYRSLRRVLEGEDSPDGTRQHAGTREG